MAKKDKETVKTGPVKATVRKGGQKVIGKQDTEEVKDGTGK